MGLQVNADQVELLPNMREASRRYLFPDPCPLPQEENRRNQARWSDRDIKIYKYVDDAVSCDRVSMDSAERWSEDDCNVREKLAVQTQNLFRRVTGKAQWKGMVVNTSKTKMLCVSDALSFIPGAYILSENGEKISSGGRRDSMKLLGYHLSNLSLIHI